MGRKNKVILPPELPPEVGDDEVEVSDEDIHFVKENRAFAGFLTTLDTKSINRHVIRVADYKEDELEALYEKRNRKAALTKLKEEEDKLLVDRVDALPIKTLDGKLLYRTAKVPTKDIPKETESEVKENDDDKGLVKLTKVERRQKMKKSRKEAKKQAKEEVKVDPVEESLHSEVLAKVAEDLSAEELFARKKIRLAEVGMSLLENPESNIKSLKELLQVCNDEDHKIIKLGLMSLLAIFRDIIPGYRIRLPTEKELEMTVSKAVQQTRFYESTLLRSYKVYLLRLIALERQPPFHLVAVRCMCNLLDAVPHFNFRESLLGSIVKNISSSDDVVRKLCCEAIKSLFANEGKHGGEATLEAVRMVAEFVKIHDCQLHPDSLDVFLSLTFDEDLGKSDRIDEERVKPGKKKRRQNYEEPNQLKGSEKKKSRQELLAKTREEVNADLKAVSFVPDLNQQRKMQSETLSAVFETYFRVLKHTMDSSVSRSKSNTYLSGTFGEYPLLSPCLNGLGKFSHLIDLDFMGDLMGYLKKLAGHSDYHGGSSLQCHLTISQRLQCCIVAFRVMRNNLDALNVDLQEFYVQLYNLLLEYRPNRDRGEVLAEALKTMLWEGKQHDMQRAAAFIKRLATFSLSFGAAEAMAALVTIKHLLLKNSKCRSLLENDVGGGSLSGLVVKYQPDASDPNLSGALASVLWELSLLSKHYNPTISSMASSIASMATMNPSHNQVYLSMASPLQAFADLSIEREISKPIGKPPSFNRKRKREKGKGEFVALSSKQIQDMEEVVNEDDVKSKLEDHFSVLRDIAENERLRSELNHTLSSISLYEEYKQQKKAKGKSEIGKRKKSGNAS